MSESLSLEERWFRSSSTPCPEPTLEIRVADLIPGDGSDVKLVEDDGLHYKNVSLRGARLLPNVPLEALMELDAEREPASDPDPGPTRALRSQRLADAVRRVRAMFREASREAALVALHARDRGLPGLREWAKTQPDVVLVAAALGIAPFLITSAALLAAAAAPLMMMGAL